MLIRTAEYYVTMMEHALGGAPDARLDLIEVLNDAVTFVTLCSDWKFRKRPPLDVVFTIGQQFVWLPDDFGELIDVCTKNNAIANAVMTSVQDIAYHRGSPNRFNYYGLYRVALSFPGQDNDQSNEQGLPTLEIWPTPLSSNPAGDLTLTYRAGAIRMDDLNMVPNIPPALSRLLTLTARLFAQGYEEEMVAEDELWNKEFQSAVEADGRQQATVGKIGGGAVQFGRGYQIREFQQISNPPNRGD